MVDVVVVGGGPAGSSAARRLVAAGADVVVLDKERFPRHKLCAGWITPQVLTDLQFEARDYPYGFLDIKRLQFHVRGPRIPVPCVQHSIRRFEFDAWVLERSGAEVIQHTVKQIRPDGEGYEIDGRFRCRHLIGAGGTSCPVRRSVFGDIAPRNRALQTATLELEFPYDWKDPDCHLWFFEHGLPGYSWYVPKADGWLNVGIGGMAARLKLRGENIREHWLHLVDKMQRCFGIHVPGEPAGYSYYVRDFGDAARHGNAYLTGDSAGLSTRDLCEGIGPAIRSGQRAADAILTGGDYTLSGVTGASLGDGVVSRCVDWAFTRDAGRRAATRPTLE
jgi:flavin-dependent dehydrogenase